MVINNLKADEIKKLIAFFYEIGTLRKVMRSHRQVLLTDDLSDNIASHSFRVALIGYFLAKELAADANKVIKMCLLHDLEETRIGDQNWIHKKYIKIFDDEIRQEQLGNIPHHQELLALSKEFEDRQSLEAKITKDADLLDQVLLLREYQWQGNKEALDWLNLDSPKGNQQERRMSTSLAKEFAEEIKRQNPSVWWAKLWRGERRQ